MLRALEDALQRWTRAGILDELTADCIRQFEGEREEPAGLRWQVLLALIFGAILLAAGIALLVAAHWDRLSPLSRFLVVMFTLIAVHAVAIAVRDRFEWLATVLHGVGTLAAGAAVALVGQIFNIQEHWPAGILLWALCALAGWWLLGDQVQQTIAMLLLPAWIVCEWMARTDGYRGSELFVARMVAMFAAVYLTGFLSSRKKLVFGVLFTVAAIALAISAAGLMGRWVWADWQKTPVMPLHLQIVGWCWIALIPLLTGWRLQRDALVPAVVVLVVAMALPHCYKLKESFTGDRGFYTTDPTFVAYLLAGALAAFLAWWGIRDGSRALINYGVVAFAGIVLWFYFSSVMDKLDRSLGLILLGVLFLGGGWALEKLRRRMVGQAKEAA